MPSNKDKNKARSRIFLNCTFLKVPWFTSGACQSCQRNFHKIRRRPFLGLSCLALFLNCEREGRPFQYGVKASPNILWNFAKFHWQLYIIRCISESWVRRDSEKVGPARRSAGHDRGQCRGWAEVNNISAMPVQCPVWTEVLSSVQVSPWRPRWMLPRLFSTPPSSRG